MKNLIILFSFILSCVFTQVMACWSSPIPEWFECDKELWTLIPKEEVTVLWTKKCRGITLNTDFPFIWNCIITYNSTWDANWNRVVTPVNVFPKLIEALMNLLMTVILIMSLLMIVVSWILIASSWGDSWKYSDWIKILKKVAVWMALLWASWVILKVINPNFFV